MLPDNNINPKDLMDLATAVPESAWNQLVDTACETFKKFVAPVSEGTYGLGRLIQAEFDGLIDVRKVYAANAVAKAQEKARQSKKHSSKKPKAPIVLAVIQETSQQTDETIRDLWTNLLAQEIVSGDVHPEFARILSRLSATDAQLLANIAETYKTVRDKHLIDAFFLAFRYTIMPPNYVKSRTFHHELLQQVNLIDRRESQWYVTKTGWSFIQAVTDPAIE